MILASSWTRYLLSDCIARLARSGFAAPEITLQLCAIESILHSSLVREPSGDPSSKYARRYHSPSHADRSTASAYSSALASTSSRIALVASLLRVRRELPQRRDEEPRQPHAFSLPFDTHPIHSVVPVAAADQRQPVHALGARSPQRADAVIVDASRLPRMASVNRRSRARPD